MVLKSLPKKEVFCFIEDSFYFPNKTYMFYTPYTPTVWAENDLITADKLNNIESGISSLGNFSPLTFSDNVNESPENYDLESIYNSFTFIFNNIPFRASSTYKANLIRLPSFVISKKIGNIFLIELKDPAYMISSSNSYKTIYLNAKSITNLLDSDSEVTIYSIGSVNDHIFSEFLKLSHNETSWSGSSGQVSSTLLDSVILNSNGLEIISEGANSITKESALLIKNPSATDLYFDYFYNEDGSLQGVILVDKTSGIIYYSYPILKASTPTYNN